MGRSWISASARIPFTPVRVGHTFGGGSRRTASSNSSPESQSYAALIVAAFFVLAFIVAYPVQMSFLLPLVACIMLAIHAHHNPDTKLAQWWIGLNDHLRTNKRAKKNIIQENDITIEVGKR
jgi:hypothetical protein